MRRLTESQAALKAKLDVAQKKGEQQRLATRVEYDRLMRKLKERLDSITPESKRRIIHALIHKVVITRNGFELHFYAGVDQIKQGEALASPAISLEKKFFVKSSFKDLNGGHKHRHLELMFSTISGKFSMIFNY